MKSGEPAKRAYRQRARAAAADRTRSRILTAVFDLSATVPVAAITLNDVATRAGVTVQTVLRRFGSREGVIDAAIEHFSAEVGASRIPASDDPRAAIDTVVQHYETIGDHLLLLLGQESSEPMALRVTENGRRLHDRWVRDNFHPRDERIQRLLVVATDLYTWKLLRRDRDLSPAQTAEHMHYLCSAVLERSKETDDE